MASFMDYYQEELRKRGTASAAPAKPHGVSLSSLNAAKPDAGIFDPGNPIGWTLDMLSRSTYGLTNANKADVDRQVEGAKKLSHGDILGGAADYISGLPTLPSFLAGPGANIALDLFKKAAGNDTDQKFLEGATSNDPALKKGHADLMEYTADEFGKAGDPNYKDVQDNVNPWVKGLGGFAEDIAADPLTFLPGQAIGAVARGIGLAAKGGKAAVKGAQAAKVAEEAAQEVAPVAEKLAAPSAVENAFEDATVRPTPATPKVLDEDTKAWINSLPPEEAAKIVPAEALAAATAPEAAAAAVPTAKAAETVVEALTKGQKLSEVLRTSPKVPALQKEIADLFETLKPKDPAAAAVAAPKEFPTPKDWAATATDTVPFAMHGITQAVPVKQVRQIYLNELQAAKGVKAAISPRGQQALDAYLSAYEGAKRAHEGTVTSAVLEGAAAFQQRLAQGGNAMRNILGDELFDHLASKTTTEGATRALTKLESLFGGKLTNLDNFLSKNPKLDAATGSLFKQELDAVKIAPNSPEAVQALTEGVTELSPVSKALSQVIREENLPGTPEFLAKYGKIARNAVAKAHDGTADWWRKTNTFTQLSVIKKLQGYISDQVRAATGLPREALFGAQRAAAQRQAMEGLGKQITTAMETLGTPLHIGIDKDLVRLTFPDVYATVGKVMDQLFNDADITNLALHNGGTAVSPSRFLNVVHQAIVNPELSADELAALIRKEGLDSAGPNAAQKIPNNITSTYRRNQAGAAGHGFHYPGEAVKRAKALSEATGGALYGTGKGRWIGYAKGGNLPEMLAAAIEASRPVLTDLAEKNAAEWAARGISEAKELTGQSLAALRRLATDESKAAQRELAAATARHNEGVAKQAAAIAATPEGTQAAAVAVEEAIGTKAVKEAEATVRQERKINAGEDRMEAGKAAMADRVDAAPADGVNALLNETHDFPEPPMPEDVVGPVEDIGEMARAEIDSATEGTWRQRLGKAFNRNAGIDPLLHDMTLVSKTRVGELVTTDVLRPVKRLTRHFSPEVLSGAMKAIQQGTRLEPGSELAAAGEGIEKIISKMIDTTGPKSVMGNVFTDSGAGIEKMNEVLKWAFGGKSNAPQFDLDAARKTGDEARALKEQWRQWDLSSDAADSLVRLGQAAARVVEHEATAASFVKTGLEHGFVVQVPKGQHPPAGFVKPVDGTGQTQIMGLFPKGTYISKEIAPSLARMEHLTTASRQISGEVGDLVRSTIVPITNTWKQGMTIYRLGHHIRNVIGNLSLQYVMRGTRDFSRSQTAAFKILGIRNSYEGVDFLQMLKSMGEDAIPSGGDVIFTGKNVGDVTAQQIIDGMSKRGLFPSYESMEGLLTEDVKRGGVLERILRPLDAANNPVGRLGGKTSEVTDHHARVAHFVQALMQETAGRGKWAVKDLNQLMDKAAVEVRKIHPDSNMLTAFENKYAKIVIPFYTWMRGVLPGALESAMMHPGRVMVFPKASYNVAVGMGLDPNSIGDPFPEDQLFPGFIRDSVYGPQFQTADGTYLRVNPGIAISDIAQSFSPDPLRGVAGMVNPLFRVPAELMSGGSWSTGGRINDTSDYVDQSIPGINYLSSLTGVSPTGSVGSLASGNGLDPKQAVAKGNSTDLDKWLAAANWLTGIGVQNLSKPNYINYAEIEKRNAASGGK